MPNLSTAGNWTKSFALEPRSTNSHPRSGICSDKLLCTDAAYLPKKLLVYWKQRRRCGIFSVTCSGSWATSKTRTVGLSIFNLVPKLTT
jgi:hypothetical protein